MDKAGEHLNGQILNITEYCIRVTAEPIEMPYYGSKNYAPKTIKAWYAEYTKGGIDALKPKARSDIGLTRVITPEMEDLILSAVTKHPKAPATVIYDMLTEEGAFLKKDVSLPTVRRFINRNKDSVLAAETPKEMLRFSMEHANDLWQTDLMYGAYVTGDNGKKYQTYLLAYIDDASRLITHAEFYLTQDIRSLRNSFSEAILRRGIPKILYTDNGKIYRCQAFEYLCANIGVSLLHHAVRAASSKGKIERFFRTVRLRFLSRLTKEDLSSLAALNEKFKLWLEEDYQRKPHEGLGGKAPRDVFLSQSEGLNLITDLAAFNEKFMIRVRRCVKKDATISLGGELYEADMSIAGMRVEVRYDPDAEGLIRELFIFSYDGEPLGTARRVNFTDNAKRKRSGSPLPAPDEAPRAPAKEHTIYGEFCFQGIHHVSGKLSEPVSLRFIRVCQ
jgi:transposase InsO family protein